MTSFTSLLRRGYNLLIFAASQLQSIFLLAIRLYWGWAFFITGKGKLTDHAPVAEFFASLHIPFPGLNAWVAGSIECFGGLLLLIGLASRLTAIPLIVTMIVAYLTNDIEVVKNIFSDPDKFTEATPFLFLLASLIVFIFGPGAFSVDYLLGRKFGARPASIKPPGEALASDHR